MIPLFRETLSTVWARQPRPDLLEIPVNKAQLIGRISSDPFDGGRTAAWMTSLRSPTMMAVRDERTGHTIHVVSDRRREVLLGDLKLGLRLMGWLSKRPVTWYWWDQPWPRRLPSSVDPGRDHVNGGWAIVGVAEVHVYRREEAHKVLLHECIHALGLDVDSAQITRVLPLFETYLGRRLWPHLGEAYTELYAEWLWSIASGSSWEYQMACSEKQAAQVWARIHDSTEDENTNVFAYYVLKWVLMQHLEVVLFQKHAAVSQWFGWWQELKRALDQKASRVSASEYKDLPMAMTCK